MSERLEAVVHGRVQMVMFRDFVCRKAGSLGLVGEVMNKRDGSVFVIAEGPKEKLEALLEHLHKGPFLADVQSVEASWKPAGNLFSSFTLRYE